MQLGIELVGVGGQGVSKAAELLAQAAAECGIHATVLESRGLAVRGGAVNVQVRLASTPTHHPRISAEHIDVLLAFEPLEGVRAVVGRPTRMAVLMLGVPLLPATVVHTDYPATSSIVARLRDRQSHFLFVEPPPLVKLANLYGLGSLAALGPTGIEVAALRDCASIFRNGRDEFEYGYAAVLDRGLENAWRHLLPP